MWKMNKRKQTIGFTLLEVVVAIGIIMTGMLGVMSLVIQNIQIKTVNRNNLVASMLAQEGLELVRNMRDQNWLDGVNYDQGLPTGSFAIDYTKTVYPAIDLGVPAARLYTDNSSGFYWHNSSVSTESIYSRLITVSNNADHLAVSSTVRWVRNGQNIDYTAETLLYDWR
jgi:type II secretory pathway pseudopilin PulG